MAIFVRGSSPLKFYMSNCPEKEEISLLIAQGGGTLLASYETGAIELAPYDVSFKLSPDQHTTNPVYSYTLVHDSLSAGVLEDLSNYELAKKLPNAIRPRKKYTFVEDSRMKEHYLQHGGNACSKAYWEGALLQGLGLAHSADSLFSHWKILRRKNSEIHSTRKPTKHPKKVKGTKVGSLEAFDALKALKVLYESLEVRELTEDSFRRSLTEHKSSITALLSYLTPS